MRQRAASSRRHSDDLRQLRRRARPRPALLPRLRAARLARAPRLPRRPPGRVPAGRARRRRGPRRSAARGRLLRRRRPSPTVSLGALRRYSGLLALTGVLLAALLIGLLVGHWITGGNGSTPAGKQVIEVKGLSGLAAAPSAGSTTGGSSSSAGTSSDNTPPAAPPTAKSSAKEEAKEDAKEVQAAKAPPVVHKKTNSQSLQKLDKTTGKQHAKEVNEAHQRRRTDRNRALTRR